MMPCLAIYFNLHDDACLKGSINRFGFKKIAHDSYKLKKAFNDIEGKSNKKYLCEREKMSERERGRKR